MYSTNNENKSVVDDSFIKILKDKIYKPMTAISINVHIPKLDETINKYNKDGTIKMKPVHVQPSTYIEHGVEHNDKVPKFRVGDCIPANLC